MNSTNSVPQQSVDLSNCDKEPIHIPGRIQSHGCLIAFDKQSGVIEYCSTNSYEWLGVTPEKVIGLHFNDFLKQTKLETENSDLYNLVQYAIAHIADDLNPLRVHYKDQFLHLILNESGKYILGEFEQAEPGTDNELQRLMGVSLASILEAKSPARIYQNAAKQVKEIIHYDRVMIYQFHEDGHGEVVGEEKNDDLEAFMGLHYPASDIPKQARDLYVINQVRIIADVNSDPSGIIGDAQQAVSSPLDLTHSVLRAVSPMHIEYLKNMGVQSSFSISIVINDQLWGLIACHNYTPRFIDYKARSGAKLIGKILSSAIQYREDTEKKEKARKYQAVLQDIIKTAIKDWDIPATLTNPDSGLLQVTEAGGAALLFENEIYLIGKTPGKEAILHLFSWLKKNNRKAIYHTDRLPEIYEEAKHYKEIASGILACSLAWEMTEGMIWFKPEIKSTVQWAGNPQKPVEASNDGMVKISPRRSFEAWTQEMEGVSAPWSAAEISSVMKLREEVLHITNEKANQIRRLNEELKKAYEELDTFSYTISHDLKTPLASVKNYTEILLEENSFSEDTTTILHKIIRSADRMNLLIREVLAYSRIGRQELKTEPVNMKALLSSIKAEIEAAYRVPGLKINIGDAPSLIADETMLAQVFTNLIGNAVKYSSKVKSPEVAIEGKVKDNEIIYTITDNGIGIDSRTGSEIFELFRRLNNAKNYEGTGVGLSIVKRIMEKHHARIWYESELNNGTIFYLSFKNL